jgi:hypothetical protein
MKDGPYEYQNGATDVLLNSPSQFSFTGLKNSEIIWLALRHSVFEWEKGFDGPVTPP